MEREDDEDYDGMDEGEDEEDEDYKPAVSFLIFDFPALFYLANILVENISTAGAKMFIMLC